MNKVRIKNQSIFFFDIIGSRVEVPTSSEQVMSTQNLQPTLRDNPRCPLGVQ